MRFLMLHKLPPYWSGGAERVVWNTATRLAELGHDVVFFCPNPGGTETPPTVENISFEFVETGSETVRAQLEYFLRGTAQYRELYERVDPDVVYDNICPFPFPLAHFYGDATTVSKVHAVYRRDAFRGKEGLPIQLGTYLGEELYRAFRDETLITNSRSTSQRLQKLVSESHNRIITNPLGINASAYEFNIPTEKHRVLCLSKINKRKQIHRVVDAWESIEPRFPDAELVIAGKGSQAAALEEHIAAADVSTVDYRGFVSVEEKHRLLQSSYLYVLPTRYEGFGLSNLEAMASGCAVITTDAWGVRDYVEPRVNALQVSVDATEELRDAIATLLEDHTLGTQLARNGRHTANMYSEQESLDREIAILTDNL